MSWFTYMDVLPFYLPLLSHPFCLIPIPAFGLNLVTFSRKPSWLTPGEGAFFVICWQRMVLFTQPRRRTDTQACEVGRDV